MKKGKISIGTIAFFISISLLRGCQDYNLQHQREAREMVKEQLEQIGIDNTLVPIEKADSVEYKIIYKK